MSFSLSSFFDKFICKKTGKINKIIISKDDKPGHNVQAQQVDIETPLPISEIKTVDTPLPAVASITTYTLHEAIKIVLSETKDKTLHASELADKVYERRLYLKRDGGKAQPTQIRLRCRNYCELFEVIPGGYIRLK